jgi:hypothetical protein
MELPPTAADIPGLYVCNFKSETQKLELFTNGKYRQWISRESGAFTNDGEWVIDATLRQYSDDLRILLSSYRMPVEQRLEGAGDVVDFSTSVKQNEESVWLVIFDGGGLHCLRDKVSHGSPSRK